MSKISFHKEDLTLMNCLAELIPSNIIDLFTSTNKKVGIFTYFFMKKNV